MVEITDDGNTMVTKNRDMALTETWLNKTDSSLVIDGLGPPLFRSGQRGNRKQIRVEGSVCISIEGGVQILQ